MEIISDSVSATKSSAGGSNTESYRNSVKRLIEMGMEHINVNFGGGTSGRLLELYDEYFDAVDENLVYETEESDWRFDLAKNNVFSELYRGLRI